MIHIIFKWEEYIFGKIWENFLQVHGKLKIEA